MTHLTALSPNVFHPANVVSSSPLHSDLALMCRISDEPPVGVRRNDEAMSLVRKTKKKRRLDEEDCVTGGKQTATKLKNAMLKASQKEEQARQTARKDCEELDAFAHDTREMYLFGEEVTPFVIGFCHILSSSSELNVEDAKKIEWIVSKGVNVVRTVREAEQFKTERKQLAEKLSKQIEEKATSSEMWKLAMQNK